LKFGAFIGAVSGAVVGGGLGYLAGSQLGQIYYDNSKE